MHDFAVAITVGFAETFGVHQNAGHVGNRVQGACWVAANHEFWEDFSNAHTWFRGAGVKSGSAHVWKIFG
jgi:hypothetical protein